MENIEIQNAEGGKPVNFGTLADTNRANGADGQARNQPLVALDER